LKTSYGRDVLAALSLANLSFIEMWDGLLNYTSAQAFYLEHAPPPAEYAAAFANVILVGLVFFLLIRFARWIAARYGTAGFILGSLPILSIVAVAPAKSIVRLLANRLPDLSLWIVAGTLVFIVAATALIARRRFFRFASAVLVTISPLILIEAVLSVSRCWTDRSAEFADGPLAPHVPQTSRPRIVWIIFDELDYRLSFLDRPSNVPMQSFDSLRKESLFAENAISPAPDTIPSVPSLLTGKHLATFQATGPSTVLFDGVPASVYPTIFSSVRAMGANVGVVGWFLPYCRVFSRDLAACSAHDLENQLSETGRTFRESVSLQLQSLFAYRNRSVLGESPRAKHRVEMLSAMHADALRDVADPSLNLVYLHLPVPHAPYLYDRFSYTFPKRYLGAGSYMDNLALADIYLGDFREAMTNAGLWDKTTVLVSSDHPDRMSLSVDGKEDPRVPFLLKLAGQTSGMTYEPVLPTIVTKPLLEAILDRKITTPEDAIKWLTTVGQVPDLPSTAVR
jgi:sulfatase-like protein